MQRRSRSLSSLVFLCLALASLLVLPAGVAAADCNYYANTGVEFHLGYGLVCGGYDPFGCTECYQWTGGASVESCVQSGQGNCFSEEHQN